MHGMDPQTEWAGVRSSLAMDSWSLLFYLQFFLIKVLYLEKKPSSSYILNKDWLKKIKIIKNRKNH